MLGKWSGDRNVISTAFPFIVQLHSRFRQSPLARRLAAGAIWALVGSAISRLAALAASVLVARILTKQNYGAFGTIQGTIGFFGAIAGFGFAFTTTKYVAEYKRSDQERAGRVVALSSIVGTGIAVAVSTLFYILAAPIAIHVLDSAALAPELRTGTWLLLIGALAGLQSGILSGLEDFRGLAAATLWSGLAAAPIQLLGAWLNGLHGAVWSLVLAALVNIVVTQIYLRAAMVKNNIRFRADGCLQELKSIVEIGSSVVLTSLVIVAGNWLGTAIVVNQKAGYNDMAIIGAANNWFGVVVFLASTTQQGIFPALAESLGRRDWRTALRIMKLALLAALAVATPLAVIGILASPKIMALYGRSFVAGWPVLAITVATAWIYCIHIFVNQFILAMNKSKLYFAMSFTWCGAFLGILWLCRSSGAIGYAVARAASYALIVIVSCVLLANELRRMATGRDSVR